IESLFNDSPSLRRDVARIITEEAPRAARLTTCVLRLHGEDVGNLAVPKPAEPEPNRRFKTYATFDRTGNFGESADSHPPLSSRGARVHNKRTLRVQAIPAHP